MSGAFDWIDWGADASIYDLLGIAGIVVALVQLFRSRGALKAAREAYNDTKSDLAMAQVLRALPALHMASTALDQSLAGTDRYGADAHLESFARTAHTVAELLKISQPNERNLSASLIGAAEEAATARARLYQDDLDPSVTIASLVGESASKLRDFVGSMHGPITKLSHSSTQSTKRKQGLRGHRR